MGLIRFSAWALGSAVATVALLEVALRLCVYVPMGSKLYVSDPDIGYRMRPNLPPNSTSVNTRGFNDTEHDVTRPDRTFRVSVIGDSFVFGAVPRKDNFVSLLNTFAGEEGVRVEFLNMGLPVAEPDNYLKLMLHDAIDMNSNMAMVVFFLGNDVYQAHPDFRTKMWLGSPRETLRYPWSVGLNGEYFYLYRTIRAQRRLIRERFQEPRDGTFSEGTFLSIEHQRSAVFRKKRSSYIEACYAGALASLTSIAVAAKETGLSLVIVLAPDEIQVNPRLRKEVMEAFSMESEDFDFDVPPVLLRHLKRMNIPTIDLLPAFLEQRGKGALYLKRDTHWSQKGNLLVARAIWDFLEGANTFGPQYMD
jgi:hypothetical protein